MSLTLGRVRRQQVRINALARDTSRAGAGARGIIKRALRQDRLPIGEPEEYIGWFMAYPWACTRAIERELRSSAKAWERDDNTREVWHAENVERLMAVIGVNLTWPGLYPTFVQADPKPAGVPCGVWADEDYDLAGLWRRVRLRREYETDND